MQSHARKTHDEVDLEAHLLKEHGIRTVPPRGLKIVEEEDALEGSPRYFSNYERERSIKRFYNVRAYCSFCSCILCHKQYFDRVASLNITS